MWVWVILAALVWAARRRSAPSNGVTAGWLVPALAEAIARMEGFYAGATRAYRNHNPGNLRDVQTFAGRWQYWPSLPHDDMGFPDFGTFDAGWNAMYRDLEIKIARGWTLARLIYAWAPPTENNSAQYLAYVAGKLGIPTDVDLRTYQG